MSRSLAGLLVGRSLADRYEIEEMIGRGGMSLVYRARDRRLRRPVAIKIISLPGDSEEEHRVLRQRLRREAAAAARVPPHPNVVQVYDYGTDETLDLDFIAMELLRGRDLKSVLREETLAYDEAVRITRETARGLSAGHRAGIVHRDVKPANIVITSDRPVGAVKLLDFGIAKALETAMDEELTRTGHVPHSPAYASPEQRDGSVSATPASDVYQLALIAYEMLAGERVKDGRVGEGERWMAIPPPVREVIERALRVDPTQRPADAAEFAEAFSRAAESQPGPAALPPAPRVMEDETSAEGATAFLTSQPGIAPAPPVRPSASAGWLRGNRSAQWTLAAVGLLLLVLVVRALAGSGEAAAPATRPSPFAAEIEALDEEFRELTEEAHRALVEDDG